MANPHMFDELTNRLNKVKRPDSGIHNSGEFNSDHEKVEKTDEQADSGRDSDPAEPADVANESPTAKKGGILKSFRKIFRLRRKSKMGKSRSMSEPDMMITSVSSKEPSIPRSNTGMPSKRYNECANDFTSDDEDIRVDEKKNSLKDAPSFLRSSLRKLKLKKKKTDSNEVTPVTVKKQNMDAPPPVVSPPPATAPPPAISPKKSPKKIRSNSRNSHSSDLNETRSDFSSTKDFSSEGDDGKSSGTESVLSSPVVVTLKDDLPPPSHAVIESSAAKDKIRVAPRGRKRPTRIGTRSKANEISDKKKPLAFISEDDNIDRSKPVVRDNDVPVEPTKMAVKDIHKKSTEDVSHVKGNGNMTASTEKTFDSIITSLESLKNKPNIPAKVSVNSNVSVESNRKSSELKDEKLKADVESVSYSLRRNTDSVMNSKKNDHTVNEATKNFENKKLSSKNSVSLGDLIIDKQQCTSLRNSNDRLVTGNDHFHISYEPLKDAPEHKRYDKYRKQRSQTDGNIVQNSYSKSVEDISILNKENKRRSGQLTEPLGTPKKEINQERTNLIDEIRRSKENMKKSSSRHSLNETVFAITSRDNQNPVIPYGDNVTQRILTNSTDDKPRKLLKKVISGSKDDISDKPLAKKPRPKSVTVRSTDTSIIDREISGAKSYGDIRAANSNDNEKPSVAMKSKPLVATGNKGKPNEKPHLSVSGKSKSVDIQQEISDSTDVPEFKRMSLRKTPNSEGYLPNTSSEVTVPDEPMEENPVLNSIKTTLKHVETKANVDNEHVNDMNNNEPKDNEEGCVEMSAEKTTINKEKQSMCPLTQENKLQPSDSSPTAKLREKKVSPPEFHRISLKKVEKRDDYLEKEPEAMIITDEKENVNKINETKTNVHEPVISPSKEVPVSVPSQKIEEIPEKPKPPIKAKPFQFQSRDIKTNDSKPPEHVDKPKPVPLSQSNKLPFFRKSVDIQENPNPHGNVPAWIAMAREKQRDQEPDKMEEDAPPLKVENEDVTEESLVKPSALKAKPTPLPKPTAISKSDAPPTSSPPPTAAKKTPPPVSQRPSLGRFNAKTDLPNDACMVCGKTAYVLERCEVNKRTLHRSCAKCYLCSRTLNLGDIFIQDERVWCKQHR